MGRLLRACLIVLSSAWTLSCGGGGGDTPAPAPTPPPIITLTLSPDSLPQATLGIPYNYSNFNVSGGNAPYTFSATGTLPPGMTFTSLSNPNTGVLSGTPTASGTFNFTLNVTDPNNHTGSRAFTFVVNTDFRIATVQLPQAKVGTAYDQPIQTVNGVGPLSFSVVSGPDPASVGVGLNTGTGHLAGVPSQATLLFFDVQATDSSSPPRSTTQRIEFRIASPLQFPVPSSQILSREQATSFSVSASGGVQPITIQHIGGPLPPGMRLNGAAFSGAPTQIGTYVLSFRAQDSYVGGPEVITGDFTIQVRERPPQIITQQMPAAVVGQPYTFTFSVDGGASPFTWNLSGTPPGLSFNTSQGSLSGTPTTAGNFDLFVGVADSSAPQQSTLKALNLNVLTAALTRNDSIASATSISNGTFDASLSPFVNATGVEAPDTDYYRVTANGGAQVEVQVSRSHTDGIMDPVLEIVNASGQRLTTCRNAGTNDGVTGAPDPTPNDFDDVCLNDDVDLGFNLNSALSILVPSGSPQTFYIHVLDFRGDARPDMTYRLSVAGVN